MSGEATAGAGTSSDDGGHESGLMDQSLGDSAGVRQYYNGWTRSYEADVLSWGYEAPTAAVAFLASRVDPGAQILDAGCGTGLVGQALKAAGYHDVVGVDLSPDSLDLAAKTQCYRALAEADFNDLPTELIDGSFSALLSIGVLSYVSDLEAVLREFSRVVESSGTIVVTERTDLFAERSTGDVFARLEADGTWKILTVTDPQPYIPGHPEFADIDVHFGVFERA